MDKKFSISVILTIGVSMLTIVLFVVVVTALNVNRSDSATAVISVGR